MGVITGLPLMFGTVVTFGLVASGQHLVPFVPITNFQTETVYPGSQRQVAGGSWSLGGATRPLHLTGGFYLREPQLALAPPLSPFGFRNVLLQPAVAPRRNLFFPNTNRVNEGVESPGQLDNFKKAVQEVEEMEKGGRETQATETLPQTTENNGQTTGSQAFVNLNVDGKDYGYTA